MWEPSERNSQVPPPPLELGQEPLFKQVKRKIIQSLVDGEWKPGEAVPTEGALAKRFGVSISTVRAAVGELVSANVLNRIQGKGTFVSLHDQHRSLYRFFHLRRNDGQRALPVSELISIKRVHDPDIADLLRLPRRNGAKDLFRIRNLVRLSGEPVMVSDISIPAHRFRGLTEKTIRSGDETLYAIYQSQFGVNIVRTIEELRAGLPAASIAKFLNVSTETPILEIFRLAFTFGEQPIEVRRSVVLTSSHHYRIDQGGL